MNENAFEEDKQRQMSAVARKYRHKQPQSYVYNKVHVSQRAQLSKMTPVSKTSVRPPSFMHIIQR